MARVTVEDCVDKISNRFDLVMTAAQRARNIAAGAPLTVEADNDKNHVISLREIAEVTVDIDALREQLIQSMQRHVEIDEPDEDELDMISIQQEVLGDTDGVSPAQSYAKKTGSSETKEESDVFAKMEDNIFAKMDIDPEADSAAEIEATPDVEEPLVKAAAVVEDAAAVEIAQDLSDAPEQTESVPESSADAEAPEENIESQEIEPESADSEKI